jgi:hypothetical protein
LELSYQEGSTALRPDTAAGNPERSQFAMLHARH